MNLHRREVLRWLFGAPAVAMLLPYQKKILEDLGHLPVEEKATHAAAVHPWANEYPSTWTRVCAAVTAKNEVFPLSSPLPILEDAGRDVCILVARTGELCHVLEYDPRGVLIVRRGVWGSTPFPLYENDWIKAMSAMKAAQMPRRPK